MIQVDKLLQFVVSKNASDLHLHVGRPPVVRLHGRLRTLETETLTPDDTAGMMRSIAPDRYQQELEESGSSDFGFSFQDQARFRVAIFKQKGHVGLVLRLIPSRLMTLEEIGLPATVQSLLSRTRGLFLVTGPTGSGKTTTLASMVNYINSTRTAHIITIEDPIEFLLKDKKSMIAQREVGFDTNGFLKALRAAMRQDPDVILVGEMRDTETIKTALMAAETGHLVLATLHTTDVMETINRLLSFFESSMASQIRLQFAAAVRAIICLRLLQRLDGSGRIPAAEVMVSTSRIRELIKDPDRTHEIADAIAGGYATYGMQTFDMSLMKLVLEKQISYQEAIEASTTPSDFALKFKGVSSTADTDLSEFQRLASSGKKKDGGKMEIERFSK